MPASLGAASRLREARRPKHSGSITADGQVGPTGLRLFQWLTPATGSTPTSEAFPFRRVTLDAYWLAGARIAYNVAKGVQLFARAANAFDADYEDAIGYRTEGRSLYAGIRIAGGS